YGSVVTGLAAAAHALDGDNVVFVGSPGVNASNVRQLGRPKAVYAGENPNDFIRLFTLPVTQAISGFLTFHLSAPSWLARALFDRLGGGYVAAFDLCGKGVYLAHGPDPTTISGIRRFSTDGECGHGYFDDPDGDGTVGLANLARITMGQGSSTTRETGPTVAPFLVEPARGFGVLAART